MFVFLRGSVFTIHFIKQRETKSNSRTLPQLHYYIHKNIFKFMWTKNVSIAGKKIDYTHKYL